MAKRRSKKESHKLLKTAILLVLFIGVWFIYNHTDIPARIQNARISPVTPMPEVRRAKFLVVFFLPLNASGRIFRL